MLETSHTGLGPFQRGSELRHALGMTIDYRYPIEALNPQLRKAVKTKGHVPTEDAAAC